MFVYILKRTLALTILSFSGSFIGGSAIGLEMYESALMASFAAVMTVAQQLSQQYLDDGKLTKKEIDETFSTAAKKVSKR
jgi:hypothetical protein